MFSIILPTIWSKPKITKNLLDIFIASSHVKEIIIINNNLNKNEINLSNKKIKVLNQSTNIFVNPAWNLGYLYSSCNKLIIANDDIIIPNNLISFLSTINLNKYGLIGVNYDSYVEKKQIDNFNNYDFNEHKINPCDEINRGFGTFMVLNKNNYHYIPNNIKIYCGDNFLFYKNKNNATIFTKIKTEMSSSSSLPEFVEYKKNDRLEYQTYISNQKNIDCNYILLFKDLNLLKNNIESLKKEINAKILVIYNKNIPDSIILENKNIFYYSIDSLNLDNILLNNSKKIIFNTDCHNCIDNKKIYNYIYSYCLNKNF